MESIYWVLSWACHRRCRHCYETRFRPYVRDDLERVVLEAEANFPRVLANLPEQIDRIVLSGGEVLLDPVRARVLLPVLRGLRDRYGARTRVVVQTTGDLVTAAIVSELLDAGAWMISVAGVDDFHVGHEGAEQQAALRDRLTALFSAHGMKPSGHQAPMRSWAAEDGPVFGFFGATQDMWIGKIWPRGRAWENGLSTATWTDNFCGEWSGGRGFLRHDKLGSEVSIEPDGAAYPCCVKTGAALGSLLDERLVDILDDLADEPALQAIDAGEPWRMGEAYGWTPETFRARSATVTPRGAPYENPCIGCDNFHTDILGPRLRVRRERRLSKETP